VEITSNLLTLGVRHKAINSTIDYIKAKATVDGKWVAENTPGPLDASFARKGCESKWVTYRVLRMLKLADERG